MEPHSQELEKGDAAALAFQNDNVATLSWQDLSVTVLDRASKQEKHILHKASGILRAGEMMALMGPSGSGKTTLLNTLAQRQTAGVTGKVTVNGLEQPLSTHRKISAFVDQEDTLIGSLTVRETLTFSGKLALPPTVRKPELRARVDRLIDAFGLQSQSDNLIGALFRKSLSGGQKRRVSVATQLMTSPKILYLDEPTSGLDSTASFEVMSFLRDFARRNKILMVVSIHQPSTKTFELFDKIYLLSQGRTCFAGSREDLVPFLNSVDLPVPPLTNPAEHILDITNVDFSTDVEENSGQERLDRLVGAWERSEQADILRRAVLEDHQTTDRHVPVSPTDDHKPSAGGQIVTLLHRSFIKSYRDLTAYWVRVAMYMGLAFMMGTVWVRLSTHQDHIQPFINAIFFASAFLSFMAVAYVPAFLEDRRTYIHERSNGLYGPTAFLASNFLTALPFLFLISILFSTFTYWMMNMRPTASAFFTWVGWLFLDLIAAESLVVLLASLFPNFVLALALTAFANGLWMSVGGFLVAVPTLNGFYKYLFHYIDYQAYVFQGMMVNEFKGRVYDCAAAGGGKGSGSECQCMYASELQGECKIAGTAVLREYGYAIGREGEWAGILVGIIVVYRLLGWGVCWWKKT